jgi:ABC-type phosphate/phosphonate transport system substrate-binding protein
MKRSGRIYLYVLLGLGILWVSPQVLAIPGNGSDSRPVILKVGYPRYAFSDVDIKDAQAALEIWTKQLVNETSFPVASKVTIYPEEGSLLLALQNNEVNLAALSSTGYLKIKDSPSVQPLFVPSSKGGVGDEFFLLVHRQSGITSAHQLRNGKILVYPRCTPDSVQILWLNQYLKGQGLSVVKEFFKYFKITETPSQAILPVFFRQADACYVPRRVFETVAEMNPQIGNQVQILCQSPPLLRGLLVIRKDMDGRLKESVNKTLAGMNTQPQGKQILTLLRYDRLIPYQPGHLANVLDCLKGMTIREAQHRKKK